MGWECTECSEQSCGSCSMTSPPNIFYIHIQNNPPCRPPLTSAFSVTMYGMNLYWQASMGVLSWSMKKKTDLSARFPAFQPKRLSSLIVRASGTGRKNKSTVSVCTTGRLEHRTASNQMRAGARNQNNFGWNLMRICERSLFWVSQRGRKSGRNALVWNDRDDVNEWMCKWNSNVTESEKNPSQCVWDLGVLCWDRRNFPVSGNIRTTV